MEVQGIKANLDEGNLYGQRGTAVASQCTNYIQHTTATSQLMRSSNVQLLDMFILYYKQHSPGVDSASNRNEYQEYSLRGKGGRCVGLTLPPSCTDCLEIWEPQLPRTLRARPGMQRDCFTFYY